ncbi:MAG: HEAT repeat domain-containing protein [Sandaracinaceae bacterium]|nr:HEAT repeat domain-containing protein [Sandaracinaceae bacterium]
MSRQVEEGLASEDPELRRLAVAALPDDDLADRGSRLVAALGDADWRVRKEAARVANGARGPPRAPPAARRGALPGRERGAAQRGARGARAPRAPRGARAPRRAPERAAGRAQVHRRGARLRRRRWRRGARGPVARRRSQHRAGRHRGARAGGRGPRRGGAPSAPLVGGPGAAPRGPRGPREARGAARRRGARALLEDRLVRRLAVRVLGFSDDPRAVRALFDAIDDPGTATSAEAATALGRLLERGGPAAREVAAQARSISGETVAALRSIAAVGRDASRRAATEVLLFARDREVLSTAAELAADDRLPPVALEAVRAWGADAVEPLVAIAGSLGARARAAALEMAAELASAHRELAPAVRGSVYRALREALEDADPNVVGAACSAMITWAGAEDAPALARVAVRLPDSAARSAGRALERLARGGSRRGGASAVAALAGRAARRGAPPRGGRARRPRRDRSPAGRSERGRRAGAPRRRDGPSRSSAVRARPSSPGSPSRTRTSTSRSRRSRCSRSWPTRVASRSGSSS